MQRSFYAYVSGIVLLTGLAGLSAASGAAAELTAPAWSPKAAAAYLDGRATWWASWTGAARDNDTFCISCHTTLPYALGRPALHAALGEQSQSPSEQKVFDNLVKRVRMWKQVEPFYPDQTRGLPRRRNRAAPNRFSTPWRWYGATRRRVISARMPVLLSTTCGLCKSIPAT